MKRYSRRSLIVITLFFVPLWWLLAWSAPKAPVHAGELVAAVRTVSLGPAMEAVAGAGSGSEAAVAGSEAAVAGSEAAVAGPVEYAGMVALAEPLLPEGPIVPPEPVQPTGSDHPRAESGELAAAAARGGGAVPVLLYHNLTPVPMMKTNGVTVLVSEFEEQMAFLEANGYHAITVREMQRWLTRKEELPPKPVLITFDDGYKSVYLWALPILKKHHLKATLFMIGDAIGTGDEDLHFLTWPQLKELATSGVFEVQSHTFHGHTKQDKVPQLVRWTAEEIRSDNVLFKKTFADNGFAEPTALAYPFGAYDDEAVRTTAEAYEMAFTLKSGMVRRSDNPYLLKRRPIFPGTTLASFEKILKGDPTANPD